MVMNAAVNGAVDIRRTITQRPPPEELRNGRLVHPVTDLFNPTSGRFAPVEQTSCEPYNPNAERTDDSLDSENLVLQD